MIKKSPKHVNTAIVLFTQTNLREQFTQTNLREQFTQTNFREQFL